MAHITTSDTPTMLPSPRILRRIAPVLIIVLLLGIAMFGLLHIKYKVQYLRRDIDELERQLVEEKQSLHVLHAEWSYLTNPSRIELLSKQHLALAPIAVAQYQTDPVEPPAIVLSSLQEEPETRDVFEEFEALPPSTPIKARTEKTPAPVQLISVTDHRF